MKNTGILLKGQAITLRLIRSEDIEQYYKAGFEYEDPEVMRFTGTKHSATKDEIIGYVNRIVEDDSRYDFLILDGNNEIIGESVLNGIDLDARCAGFRITLFHRANFGRGVGTEATRLTVQFGFEQLHLHRIELEVFSFNERAYRAYRKAGFKEEGRRRDGELIDGQYCDVILMGILENEYNRDSTNATAGDETNQMP